MRWVVLTSMLVALCACDEGTTEVEGPEDRLCPSGGPEIVPDVVVVVDSWRFKLKPTSSAGHHPRVLDGEAVAPGEHIDDPLVSPGPRPTKAQRRLVTLGHDVVVRGGD